MYMYMYMYMHMYMLHMYSRAPCMPLHYSTYMLFAYMRGVVFNAMHCISACHREKQP